MEYAWRRSLRRRDVHNETGGV